MRWAIGHAVGHRGQADRRPCYVYTMNHTAAHSQHAVVDLWHFCCLQFDRDSHVMFAVPSGCSSNVNAKNAFIKSSFKELNALPPSRWMQPARAHTIVRVCARVCARARAREPMTHICARHMRAPILPPHSSVYASCICPFRHEHTC